MLIALLYRTGLRINEALSVYPKDLELTDGSVRVLNGKGGRSRTVGLDPGAAAIIERWLDARSRLGLGGRHPVFCTLRGHPMSDAYVRVMLKRLAARAGIDKRVHAHGLSMKGSLSASPIYNPRRTPFFTSKEVPSSSLTTSLRRSLPCTGLGLDSSSAQLSIRAGVGPATSRSPRGP
jgi:hypothetical protein